MALVRFVSMLLACGGLVAAQCSITTTFAANNSSGGNMFDIVAAPAAPIEIFGFQGNLEAGQHTVEVYARTGGGSFVGVEQSPQAWTLLGRTTVSSAGPDQASAIPMAINLVIPAGATQGLYITTTGSNTMRYTQAGTFGAVTASNAHLEIRIGRGVSYPFGITFTPRIWNGTAFYRVLTPTCPVTPWQMNQVGASLILDRAGSNGREPAILQQVPGAMVTMSLASSTRLPYDVGLSAVRNLALGEGGILLPSGTQVVNLNLFSPSFRWLGPGTFTGPFLPVALPLSLSFRTPAQSVSMQMVALDPAAAEGVSLSQAASLAVLAPQLNMPLGDDQGTVVSLVAPPINLRPYALAGTTYTEVTVETNGRVRFASSPSQDFTPTLSEALSEEPFFGLWTDIVNMTGTGRIVSDGISEVRFRYANNRYITSTTNNVNFELAINTLDGSLIIDEILTLGPPTRTAFLGLSLGAPLAIDAGPVRSFNAGSTWTVTGGEMIYEFGATIPSLGRVNSIVFQPAGGTAIDVATF